MDTRLHWSSADCIPGVEQWTAQFGCNGRQHWYCGHEHEKSRLHLVAASSNEGEGEAGVNYSWTFVNGRQEW